MLGACAGRVESSVRKKAAADFGCTAEKISIGETQDPWKRTALYRAHGCDKTHMYEATCHLFACKASTAARLGLAKPIDDPGDVEYTPEEDKRRADEAKPKRFDVKVFSLCKDAEVKLLIDGAAQQSKYLLKGGMVTLDRSSEGTKIWIVDRASEATKYDEVELSEARPILYVDETCKQFKKEGQGT